MSYFKETIRSEHDDIGHELGKGSRISVLAPKTGAAPFAGLDGSAYDHGNAGSQACGCP